MSSPVDVTTLKLLLMGDSGTGKSSLLLRFCEDKFLGDDLQSATIGVDFKVKFIELEDQKLKLTIWDTAGQERFRTLTSSYYRGAQGVIIVYDVCNRESFENLKNIWIKELSTYTSLDELVLMVEHERMVSISEGEDLAKELSALFMECSAKTRIGVKAAFEDLVHQILHSPKALKSNTSRGTSRIQIVQQPEQSSACNC